jgi:glutamate synthase domain-containing protein 3
MSGGIAYVLDADGGFRARCNMELVGFDELSADDQRELRGLIAEHAQRTGSPVAERVLSRWSEHLPRFVKVMPHDYKRALAELAEEAAGVTGDRAGAGAPASSGAPSGTAAGPALRG